MRARMAAVAAGGVGLFALGLAAASPGVAQAAQIINFTGNCMDCSGQGVGTLTLNSMPDGALTKADFMSFAYKSNLVSFDLTSADIVAVMGSVDPNNLGATYIDVLQLGGTGWEFIRNSDGSWSVSNVITQGEAGQMGPGGAMTGGGGGGGGGDGGGFSWTGDNGANGDRTVDDFGSSSSFSLDSITDQVAGVPEPASWALMLIGFAGLGGAVRRRRQTASGIETA